MSKGFTFCGIKFAPLCVPLHRRLETLAAAAWFVVIALGSVLGLALALRLLATRFWWFSAAYFAWIFLDRHACSVGGRANQWVRNWSWWYYLRHYFPIEWKFAEGFQLDPKRNYLIAGFPHGMWPVGTFTGAATNHCDFYTLYPNFQIRMATLNQLFYFPFIRELLLAIGAIGVSSDSIRYVLTQKSGGYMVGLMPGGAAEAQCSAPGRYQILLAKRKGFIKMALECGSPIIPVFSFGETDLFGQIHHPLLRVVQDWVRKWTGFAPILLNGRGFFQYSFGLIPRRTKVVTVSGKPIDVQKTIKPTQEQIDELHALFCKELVALFDEYKKFYIENYEDAKLEI